MERAIHGIVAAWQSRRPDRLRRAIGSGTQREPRHRRKWPGRRAGVHRHARPFRAEHSARAARGLEDHAGNHQRDHRRGALGVADRCTGRAAESPISVEFARRVLHLSREERNCHQSRDLRRHELGSTGGDGRVDASSHRRRDEADGCADRFGDAGRRFWRRHRIDLSAEHVLFDGRADRADEVRYAVQGWLRRAHQE